MSMSLSQKTFGTCQQQCQHLPLTIHSDSKYQRQKGLEVDRAIKRYTYNQATIGNGNRAGNDDLAVKESASTVVAVSRCRRGPLADVASEAPPSFRTQHIPPHFFRNARALPLSLCQACRMCTPAERRFFAPPLPRASRRCRGC